MSIEPLIHRETLVQYGETILEQSSISSRVLDYAFRIRVLSTVKQGVSDGAHQPQKVLILGFIRPDWIFREGDASLSHDNLPFGRLPKKSSDSAHSTCWRIANPVRFWRS